VIVVFSIINFINLLLLENNKGRRRYIGRYVVVDTEPHRKHGSIYQPYSKTKKKNSNSVFVFQFISEIGIKKIRL
jgi:hypothetical protein